MKLTHQYPGSDRNSRIKIKQKDFSPFVATVLNFLQAMCMQGCICVSVLKWGVLPNENFVF